MDVGGIFLLVLAGFLLGWGFGNKVKLWRTQPRNIEEAIELLRKNGFNVYAEGYKRK